MKGLIEVEWNMNGFHLIGNADALGMWRNIALQLRFGFQKIKSCLGEADTEEDNTVQTMQK